MLLFLLTLLPNQKIKGGDQKQYEYDKATKSSRFMVVFLSIVVSFGAGFMTNITTRVTGNPFSVPRIPTVTPLCLP